MIELQIKHQALATSMEDEFYYKSILSQKWVLMGFGGEEH